METYINKYGIKVIRISDMEVNLSGTYITANGWVDENRIIAAQHIEPNIMECTLVMIDVKTGKRCVAASKAKWPCFCVNNGRLYYTYANKIYCYYIKDEKTELIYEGGAEVVFEGPPGITSDGRYISLQHQQGQNTAIDLLDVCGRKLETVYISSFFPPFAKATHSMVNPVNPNEVFFCHEGDCRYITNRMWLYSKESNKAVNFYRQRLDIDGGNGDCCGHEMWAKNGESMFFVKYPASTIEPKGIFRINTSKGHLEFIAGKYPYWHIGVYGSGELLAADTMEEGGDVHIVLIHNREERIIADAKTQWAHPVHPHPVFSPSGKRLYFTTMNNAGRAELNICEIDALP